MSSIFEGVLDTFKLSGFQPNLLFCFAGAKEAASEYTNDKEHPDNSDTEGCLEFTSKILGPNNGEETALHHKKTFKVIELELYLFYCKS
jgi:hypothetical protein